MRIKIAVMTLLIFASVNSYGEDASIGQGLKGLLDQVAMKVKTAAATSTGTTTVNRPARSIKETKLHNIFEQFPYEGSSSEWPRIAITVDSYTWAITREMVPLQDECWLMHAKIWYSPKKSEDVAPFSVCGHGADIQFKEGEAALSRFVDGGITNWSVGFATLGAKTTNNRRTDGPLYPQKPLPSGPTDRIMVSEIREFLHIIFVNMAFDYSVNDRRVWFVAFNGRQKSTAAGAW